MLKLTQKFKSRLPQLLVFSLYQEKRNKKTNKRIGSSKVLSQKFALTIKRI